MTVNTFTLALGTFGLPSRAIYLEIITTLLTQLFFFLLHGLFNFRFLSAEPFNEGVIKHLDD